MTAFKIRAVIAFEADGEAVGERIQEFFYAQAITARIDALAVKLRSAEDQIGARVPLAGLKLEIADVLNRADAALCEAKRAGRNRIVARSTVHSGP